MLLGHPIKPIVQDAAMGIVGMAISSFYDQTVGPIVQRFSNTITGRGDEPVKPGAPLTPGKIVSGFVDSVLSSLLVRSVSIFCVITEVFIPCEDKLALRIGEQRVEPHAHFEG